VSSESKDAILSWLEIKDRYLETAIRRSHINPKKRLDNRLFPFEYSVAYSMWNNALDKARFNGKDSSTNRRKMHPHVLCKFFRTRIAPLVSDDIAEALMGHEGYLTQVYRRYSLDDLAKAYKEGEQALLVFSAGNLSKIKKEMAQRDKNMSDAIATIAQENFTLKSQIRALEDFKQGIAEDVKRFKIQEQNMRIMMKDIKYLQNGGVILTAGSKRGFLPGQVDQHTTDALEWRVENLTKELQEIEEILAKRKTSS
jgi:hypothetical protein